MDPPDAPRGCGAGAAASRSFLSPLPFSSRPSGGAAAEALALGEALLAAADGDTSRIVELQRRQRHQQQYWAQQDWQRREWAPRRQRREQQRPGPAEAPAPADGCELPAFPSPGEASYDKVLVTAAKHGREAVLRLLLPPLLSLPPLQLQTRGALLMGIALQRRQVGMVHLLLEHGLYSNALEGHRLLQKRPAPQPAAPGCRPAGRQQPADPEPVLLPRNGAASPSDEAARSSDKMAVAASVASEECDEALFDDGGEDKEVVLADAAAALALLQHAQPGGRDERLLNGWLLAGARPDGDGPAASAAGRGWLCGRRCVALLRAALRAPELPVGARAVTPRALLQQALLPFADMDLLEVAFEWIDRAEHVSE